MREDVHADRVARAMLDAVVAGLEVRLLGQPLSGKSTAVRRLADLAGESGIRVTTIRGIAPLRSQSYGALTSASIGIAAGPATLNEALAELAGANRIFVIDDVGDVDAHSLGALLAAAQRAGRPLITTGRSADDFDRLDGRPAIVVQMPGSTYVDTLSLITTELGGRVAPGTVRRVHGKSGGLPGLAAQVTKIARLEGTLKNVNGVWTAADRLWTPSMQGLVTPYFESLSPADIEALRILSSVQSAYADDARTLVGEDSYARLLRNGRLREFGVAESTMFAVFPPLIVEYFRSSGHEHNEKEYRELADVPALSSLAQVDWRRAVDSVMRTSEGPVSTAIAIRTLRMAIATGADIDPALLTRALPGTSAEDVTARLWEAFILITRGDEAGAEQIFMHALEAHPDLEGFIVSARAHAAFAIHSDTSVADNAPQDANVDLNSDGWSIVRAETALARGRVSEARAALDEMEGSTSTYFASFASALRCLSLLIEGRLDEATSRALDAIEGAIERYDLEAISMYGYTAAVGLYTAGRDEELLVVLDLLLSVLVRTPSMHGGYTNGILGCAASQASDDLLDASAQELAEQMTTVSSRPGSWPFASRAFTLGLVHNTTQDFRPARDEAEQLLDAGLVAAGLVHEAIIGWLQPTMVDSTRVREAVAQTDSPLLRALGELAIAAAAGHEGQLILVSEELAALGARRAALGARISIAVGAAPENQPVLMYDALRWALQKAFPLDLIKKVIPMRWIFSPRETDIVALASADWSAKDIADRLAISTRTVEGHLSAIYRKIGIGSRAELPPSALFT